jgi:hypothetical protein
MKEKYSNLLAIQLLGHSMSEVAFSNKQPHAQLARARAHMGNCNMNFGKSSLRQGKKT